MVKKRECGDSSNETGKSDRHLRRLLWMCVWLEKLACLFIDTDCGCFLPGSIMAASNACSPSTEREDRVMEKCMYMSIYAHNAFYIWLLLSQFFVVTLFLCCAAYLQNTHFRKLSVSEFERETKREMEREGERERYCLESQWLSIAPVWILTGFQERDNLGCRSWLHLQVFWICIQTIHWLSWNSSFASTGVVATLQT